MTGESTDNQKVVFMFQFVKKVTEITSNKEHYSPKCIVKNLGWRILIERKTTEDEGEFEYVDTDAKDSLTVKIHCGGESELWCSYARIRLSLLSQKEGVEDYSREKEDLLSGTNPMCGFPDFIDWDKVVDPVNGFVKDNILKFQAYIVATIQQDPKADISRDMPENHEDWLALFEGNLNDKIVSRISSEFLKMNAIIERSLTDEEMSEKIISAAVDPVNAVIRSEIQNLEKRLEKFCANHIAKVVRELRNMKDVASGSVNNEMFEGKSDYESNKNLNGNDMSTKKVHTVEEETVPVSVLKIMKELIVEQQRTSFGTWMPGVYGTRAAYYRTNELHSYQPDSIREAEEFRLQKGVLQPLAYDNNVETFETSNRQPEDTAASSETKRGNDGQFSGTAQQQLRKNEKRKTSEEIFESQADEMSAKLAKPSVPDETTLDMSDKEIVFLGKNADGDVQVHKVYHSKQLLELKKKYSSYKILDSNEI